MDVVRYWRVRDLRGGKTAGLVVTVGTGGVPGVSPVGAVGTPLLLMAGVVSEVSPGSVRPRPRRGRRPRRQRGQARPLPGPVAAAPAPLHLPCLDVEPPPQLLRGPPFLERGLLPLQLLESEEDRLLGLGGHRRRARDRLGGRVRGGVVLLLLLLRHGQRRSVLRPPRAGKLRGLLLLMLLLSPPRVLRRHEAHLAVDLLVARYGAPRSSLPVLRLARRRGLGAILLLQVHLGVARYVRRGHAAIPRHL
mmetsp:Transcript_2979/g.6624  ORF Transcript_2979/g.6624 Transcript_2979/m.6624 type:complete len:249 (-) Transcript_2979:8-754(-)